MRISYPIKEGPFLECFRQVSLSALQGIKETSLYKKSFTINIVIGDKLVDPRLTLHPPKYAGGPYLINLEASNDKTCTFPNKNRIEKLLTSGLLEEPTNKKRDLQREFMSVFYQDSKCPTKPLDLNGCIFDDFQKMIISCADGRIYRYDHSSIKTEKRYKKKGIIERSSLQNDQGKSLSR